MRYTKLSVLLLAIVGMTLFAACSEESGNNGEAGSDGETADGALPKFEWDRTNHDFGTIQQGEVVTYTYKFTNTGDAPLQITEVKPSCGCTAPEWSKDPIEPGATGSITVEFNSEGKSGKQQKSVTVLANTDPRATKLEFTAQIEGGEES